MAGLGRVAAAGFSLWGFEKKGRDRSQGATKPGCAQLSENTSSVKLLRLLFKSKSAHISRYPPLNSQEAVVRIVGFNDTPK